MRKSKAVIGVTLMLILIAAGCSELQSVLNLKKPTASLAGFKFGDINMQDATLLFDVEVDNPYGVALPLLNMDYGVNSGQDKLFAGKADVATTIPANSKKVVSLPVKIGYMDFAKALKGMVGKSSIPYAAEVGLSMDTPGLGNLRLPLKKEGQLTVPDLNKVDWKKIITDTITK